MLYNLHPSSKEKESNCFMTDTTQDTSRELTMKDFFREENGQIVPVDEIGKRLKGRRRRR